MDAPGGKTVAVSTKIVIAAIVAAAVAVIAIIVAVVALRGQEETDSGRIGYSSDAVVVLDEDELQAALDEAAQNAANGNVALWYQNNAYSDDGTHFMCFIGNSKSNLYDCFLTIFTDAELTDQVFLSSLVPPGSGFEEIDLDHPLDAGDHTVYVAVTLVSDDENGDQVIRGQVVHTMEFHVNK